MYHGSKERSTVFSKKFKNFVGGTAALFHRKTIASLVLAPYFRICYHVKKGKVVSDHLHLNFTYLFEADENESLHIKEDENKDVKWLDIENLEDYISENDKLMIPIYRKELRDYGKQTD